MHDKVYIGTREGDAKSGSIRVMMSAYGASGPLPPRLDLKEHSTTLEWGYGQGGPAQLALALLADVTGSDTYAERHHHWFKQEVVSRMPWDGWELTESEVWDWIMEHHPPEDSEEDDVKS